MKKSIAIVDYGMGNIKSVAKAVQHVAPNITITITSSPQIIADADRVILPGQGAMPDCMRCIHESDLFEAVIDSSQKKPLLGICVGEQMLFFNSDEGNTSGFGILPGKVIRFKHGKEYKKDGSFFKIPHVGWNRVRQTKPHPMWNGIANDEYFYFVHSYYAVPDDPFYTVGETEYGIIFSSAVASINIFATQFHPEKSAKAGLQLYRNFVYWNP